MKKKSVKIAACLAAAVLAIPILGGLDYLVNEDRKTDPVKESVKAAQKDKFNQYGLEQDTGLSDESYYEDEEYIFYADRILKKFVYESGNIGEMAEILAKLQNIVPEDVNQYLLPIPERIMWEPGYAEEKAEYSTFLQDLEGVVPDKMKLVNVLPVLEEHPDEYLFFRTDSGWTARGAYYGSQALCGEMGITPIELAGYEEYMFNTFQGSLQQSLKDKYENAEISTKLEGIPEDPLYYYLLPGAKNRSVRVKQVNHVETTDNIQTVSKSRTGKAAFIGSNYQWAVAEGDGKSKEKEKKTALLVCDENGQLLVPYLASYYDKVYVVNGVYNDFGVEDFENIFEEHEISDFILTQSAERIGDVSQSKFLKTIRDIAD